MRDQVQRAASVSGIEHPLVPRRRTAAPGCRSSLSEAEGYISSPFADSVRARPTGPLQFIPAMTLDLLLASCTRPLSDGSSSLASETATLAFLHSKGIPVLKIYDHSASADNPAQTECILMEFSTGRDLGSLRADMNEHGRLRFVRSLVKLERCLFNLRLPASASLYFSRDLSTISRKIIVDSSGRDSSDAFYVGPSNKLTTVVWQKRSTRR